MKQTVHVDFSSLKAVLEGDLLTDQLNKILYSTDASVYKEEPLAVILPKYKQDIVHIVNFARENGLSLIPRAGGTSLSGQCVGNGIVVDVSKYMNRLISLDVEAREVTVQPGLIRDELNRLLEKHGLFFAPITSTSNRANIGGMVGNNSCGQNSIVYGNTRDYCLKVEAVLSDGSEVVFEELTASQFEEKLKLDTLEGQLYRDFHTHLADPTVQENIQQHFPKPSITRRNTGYALDAMLNSQPFTDGGAAFNFCKLLTGSEGTLAFWTEITLKLCPLPPKHPVVAICQYHSVRESLQAVTQAMAHQPFACELMDKTILDCTRDNLLYRDSLRFFEGDPEGVLMVEFRADTLEAATQLGEKLITDLKENSSGYAFSLVKGEDTNKVWELRKAGLGLLANLPGDPKAVANIEDTAVSIEDLADYIEEFDQLMDGFGQKVVHYAHAGAGELHLRPILDLKKSEDRKKFYEISLTSAQLVKKYQGSLSGEHGDGRVRAPFIPLMVGEENYQLFQSIKKSWDPHNLFNPHKIIDPKPLIDDLRYEENQKTPEIPTVLDFSATGGILRMAEKCNGSGDCRKLHTSGGTMCPSYQATKDEKHTTRGRANALRTLLTQNKQGNPFDHEELKETLDLCISCKGCTSECPSNVDMANLKAEFLYQYQKTNGVPLRSRVFANINSLNTLGSIFPAVSNFFLGNPLTGNLLKKTLGVAESRKLPALHPVSLRDWYAQKFQPAQPTQPTTIYLFCDEFTNLNDTPIGMKAIELFNRLGYAVKLIDHEESGRAALSKGLLDKAKKHANSNVTAFQGLIDANNVLIGIEPSALLSFRDEYPKLVDPSLREGADHVAKHTFLVEEFITREIRAGRITSDLFDETERDLLVHAHCHQKALSRLGDVRAALSLPKGHKVTLLKTGCCGMAGSFGYEKEHYEVSMAIGELVLFPAVRDKKPDQIVVAPGTSCRHQIQDGTREASMHPVEVLWVALR